MNGADVDGGERVDLNGKVAVVTGAGRGICRAMAIELAGHGAAVVVVDTGGHYDGRGLDSTVANDTVSEIVAAGGVRDRVH